LKSRRLSFRRNLRLKLNRGTNKWFQKLRMRRQSKKRLKLKRLELRKLFLNKARILKKQRLKKDWDSENSEVEMKFNK